MARLVRRKCPCLRPKMEEEVRVLDYRHSSLTDVPSEVFNWERTLEELYADSNQIRDLPRELFYCHGLRKLSISDNEITSIPPAVAGLDYLEELDFSKNGIIDVPDNIKCCKYLRVIDASVNPLGKLPDGFTQLQNLTHLYLNDTFLDYLPGSFGRLVKLRIVEMRENHLKTLPKSFGRLTELERLDIGNNEFTELPDVVGSLSKLLELWCDNNQITSLTHTLGGLKQLIFLDASKNQLTSLPGEIEGCTSLADLHLTSNHLRSLPHTLGSLSSLTTLKVDDNQMTSLPSSLGGLTSLSELNVSVNDLEELPSSIGLLRNLRTFYADDNLLTFVPAELGSCSGITVLSLRSNKLTYVPDEMGRIPRLRVLNLSDNQLTYLPFTIVKLKELQALWLTENQTRPLIPLQSDYEPDTGRKILTCYLLPQGLHSPHDEGGGDGDSDSFHASMWEEQRLQRQQIHFSFDDDDEDEQGHLVRCPTPYPKEMREKSRHMRNLALRQSVSDSTQQPSRSPQSHSVRTQGRTSSLANDEDDDITAASEGRAGHPHGPSLQETHRLYRCDKEKQLRDKARMHHSQSLPTDVAAYASASVPATPAEPASAPPDTDEGGRVAGRRKSTPNLFSFEGRAWDGKQPRRMPSFTYEDLYQKQILRKHHHHRGGRRSRRMREYDSDTGYRSDREEVSVGRRRYNGDLTDDLSVRSQPTLSRCHHRQQGREGAGYASDLEAYAGRGRGGGGFGRGSNRSSTAPSPKPRTIPPQSYGPSPGACQDLRAQGCPGGQSQVLSTPFRPQSCLTVPTFRPDVSSSSPQYHHQQHRQQQQQQQQQNHHGGAASPAPSQGSGTGLQDCHSPQRISQPPEDSQSSCDQDGSGRHCWSAIEGREGDVQADMLAALPERSKSGQKPVPATRRSPTVRQTPPPYHPAPPYRRPSDRGSERSDSSSGVPRSPRDSDLGSSSFSNPDFRAVQGRDLAEEEAPGGHALGEVFATPRDAAAQYRASGRAGGMCYGGDRRGDAFLACAERQYSDDVGSDGAFAVNRQYRETGATTATTTTGGGGGGGGGGFPSERQYREGGSSGGVDGDGDDNDDPHVSSDRQHHYQTPAATLQDRADNQHNPPPPLLGHGPHYRTPHHPAFRPTPLTPHTPHSYGQGGSSSAQDSGAHARPGTSVWQAGGSNNSSNSTSTQQGNSNSSSGSSTREGGSASRVGAQWSRTTYLDSGGEEGGLLRSDSGPRSGQNYGVPGGRGGPGSFYAAVQSRPLSGGGGGGGGSGRTPSAYMDRPRDHLAPTRDQSGYSERTHSPQLHSQSSHLQSQPAHLQSQPAHLQSQPAHLHSQPAHLQSQPAHLQSQSPHLQSQPAHLHPQPAHLQSQSPHLPSHLPHTTTTTTTATPFQTRTGSREKVLEGQAVLGGRPRAAASPPRSSSQRALEAYPRTLEAYPNPYGEPLEVGDPLMRRYEDVALFKSVQDPSQVSSSTDSGYGHGHHVYERIGDLTAKRAGSPYSSTPSHRGTPVRRSSSSQGTASREATPVREESFDPAASPLPTQFSRDVFHTVLQKKPGLGFSIAGGMGCQDLNPFRTGDSGIFVTKVQAEGPAATLLQPGDKLLQVNHVDFTNIDHTSAVNVLKTSSSVDLLVERVQKINMV